jgi:hypothetical protein
MVDPVSRERFDRTWALYPFEHPAAYWLRSNGETILCLRCSSRMEPVALGEDPAPVAQAFTDKHLSCPLGFGLRGPRPSDPLFQATA